MGEEGGAGRRTGRATERRRKAGGGKATHVVPSKQHADHIPEPRLSPTHEY